MTQLENYMSQPCLEYTIYSSFENISPDGINDLYFIDKEVEKKIVD
jgi:hypothetical protein